MISSARSYGRCVPLGVPVRATHDYCRFRRDDAHLVDKGNLVLHAPHVFSFPRDPDDEPYVDLAIATQSSFLVSRDSDLLDLMKDEASRTAYPGLTILDPVAFLSQVRAR